MNRLPLVWIDRCGAIAATVGLAFVIGWWASDARSDRPMGLAPAAMRGGPYGAAEWAEAARAPVQVLAEAEELEEPEEPDEAWLVPAVQGVERPRPPSPPSLEAVIGSVAAPMAAFRLPGRRQPVLVRPGEEIPGTGLGLREIVRRRVAVRHRDGWPVDEVQTSARLVGPEGERELLLGQGGGRAAVEQETKP